MLNNQLPVLSAPYFWRCLRVFSVRSRTTATRFMLQSFLLSNALLITVSGLLQAASSASDREMQKRDRECGCDCSDYTDLDEREMFDAMQLQRKEKRENARVERFFGTDAKWEFEKSDKKDDDKASACCVCMPLFVSMSIRG